MDETNYAGQKVLVGVDGSTNGAAALGWAVKEAEARMASVEAVFVWQEPTMLYSAPGYIPLMEADVEEMSRRMLSDALDAIPPVNDVKVGLRAVSGGPVTVLTRAAEEPDVAMTAVGARGRGGVAGLLLGSVSHSLTHHCRKPLAIVPANFLDSDASRAQQRIVVGVDGSEESKRALLWAVGEASARGVPVEAVMVWSTPSPVLPAHLPLDGLRQAGQETNVEESLRAFVSDVESHGIQVDCTLLSGHPSAALLEHAGNAQLLVVGSRGLGRAHETISGSVSHACTHHASLPVVVVPNRH